MKYAVVLLLASGCTSANPNAVSDDMASGDDRRLGEFQPDLADPAASPDLAHVDLLMSLAPDLAASDLAHAPSDMTVLPDLLTPPDLTTTPDLVMCLANQHTCGIAANEPGNMFSLSGPPNNTACCSGYCWYPYGSSSATPGCCLPPGAACTTASDCCRDPNSYGRGVGCNGTCMLL